MKIFSYIAIAYFSLITAMEVSVSLGLYNFRHCLDPLPNIHWVLMNVAMLAATAYLIKTRK